MAYSMSLTSHLFCFIGKSILLYSIISNAVVINKLMLLIIIIKLLQLIIQL